MGRDKARPAETGSRASTEPQGVSAASGFDPARCICPTCGTRLKQPKVEPATAFGRRRAALGLSLQQVANLAGITKTQVWEIERKSGTANPRLVTLRGLAAALRWSVPELLTALTNRDEGGNNVHG
jgi:DNA-binding XRE family transcriptional regulator